MPQLSVAPTLATRLSSIVALQPPVAGAVGVTVAVTAAPPETVQLYGAAWICASVAYSFLSAKYASCAEARFFRSDFIWATYAFSFVFANFGIAIAARMPMITTTIRSSISVKPFRLLRIVSFLRYESARAYVHRARPLIKQGWCHVRPLR